MLYLVNCEVIKSYYMVDETVVETVNHIVDADSEDIAKEKVKLYYDNKYVAYDVSYWVNINYCNEQIL